jgi:AraC family transcriptional regulator of adaptative response / DNA-3-methyladenine glycosylase II
MIDGTALPLAEIAFAAGFNSVRRFNAAFRATYGRTPSSFRKRG